MTGPGLSRGEPPPATVPSGELRAEIRRLMRERLLAAGVTYRDLALLGLWCGVCGSYDDPHDCRKGPTMNDQSDTPASPVSTNYERGSLVAPTGAATDLGRAIAGLIEQYGLAAVYYDVRERDGFCSNCGTPDEPDAVHQMAGMGYCEVVR